MPYSTSDIRNIALVGQAGAGKTLLAEALLALSGAVKSKGSLARGTTVCDFDPQEKALLHSLDAAICGFETQGRRVNMIDTPGYPDFLGRSLCALEAVETAVIVVSAVNGVEPMTQRMMEFAKTRGLCRLIVVNKIDSREARTEEVLQEIRETFGRACLPLNLPADGGKRPAMRRHHRVVACATRRLARHGASASWRSLGRSHLPQHLDGRGLAQNRFEALHVDRVQVLRVLYAPAQRTHAGMGLLRVFVEIEDVAVGAIADRMRVELIAIGSREPGGARDHLQAVDAQARVCRVVGVGLQQQRAARAQRAVSPPAGGG
jgi:small GTP-binding protein